jgi:hypothetical protein
MNPSNALEPGLVCGSTRRVWLWNCFQGIIFISANMGVREIDLNGVELDKDRKAAA